MTEEAECEDGVGVMRCGRVRKDQPLLKSHCRRRSILVVENVNGCIYVYIYLCMCMYMCVYVCVCVSMCKGASVCCECCECWGIFLMLCMLCMLCML